MLHACRNFEFAHGGNNCYIHFFWQIFTIFWRFLMPFLQLLFMVLALGQNDRYNCYISVFLEWLLCVTAKLIEMVWYLHPSYKHRRHVSRPPFTHLVQLGTFKGQPVCAWPLLHYPALFRGIHVVHFSSFLCILQHGHRSWSDCCRLI